MKCSNCAYWKRDGVDGICFGGTPQPKIVELDKEYVLIWPKTKVQEFCSGFKQVEEAE